MRRPTPAQILLAIAAFLAPWMGGQILAGDPVLAPGDTLGGVLFGGAPTLSHALLGLLAGAAMLLCLRPPVLQTLRPLLMIPLGLLYALLLLSVATSSFRHTSLVAFLEWAVYGIALLATVAAAGRSTGPRILIAAMFAGCVVAALIGLREYGDQRAIDPNWRIFCNWANPNAAAAVLLIGFFLGLGVTSTSQRLYALLAGLGTVLIALALFLTGSKGAVALALPISLALYGALSIRKSGAVPGLAAAAVVLVAAAGSAFLFLRGQLWSAVPLGVVAMALPMALFGRWKQAIPGVASLALLGVMIVGLQQQVQAQAASQNVQHAAVLSRISNAAAEQDQSAEFRLNLWRTAVALVRENPAGWGLNTFQFESARPGLGTQTVLTHNTYLQLAAEASPFAALALLVFGGAWLWTICRGSTRIPDSQNVLRAAAASAAMAVMIHGAVDSNLYYFGLGFLVFMLAGVALLLAGDGVAPENNPVPVRVAGAVAVAGATLGLLWFGVAEVRLANASFWLQERRLEEARAAAEAGRAMAPADGRAWRIVAIATPDPAARAAVMQRATELAPVTRNFRLLSDIREAEGDREAAASALNAGLRRDPNNLRALWRLLDLRLQQADMEEAENVARRIVAVEETPYYRIRSQPDIVETTTYEARLFLAERTQDPAERDRLLRPALEGYIRFAERTVPQIVRFAKQGGMPDLDTVAEARTKLDRARRALALYLGDAAFRQTADAAYLKALDSLPSE